MASKKRKKIKLKSTESFFQYHTEKNNTTAKRIELNKYDPVVRRHVKFKEAK